MLRWYRRNRRDLPWRHTRDPYAIWVSEVMLQQTRVEAVIPFYGKFLARFPTVHDLAAAEETEVRAVWSGLGYYGRARNLKAAAALVAREYGGEIPRERAALRALPGIGPYTASAIASIAFDQPAAAVDGNVIRVMARLAGLKGRRDSPALRKEADEMAARLAHGESPGEWTQALMELGALVCLPRRPLCEECPVRKACKAFETGRPDRYPEPMPARRVPRALHVLLLARRAGKVLLTADPTDNNKTWSLPQIVVPPLEHRGTGPSPAKEGQPRRSREAAESLAAQLLKTARVRGPIAEFRHRTYACDHHYEIWEVFGLGLVPKESGRARWVDPEKPPPLPLRSPTFKVFKRLRP